MTDEPDASPRTASPRSGCPSRGRRPRWRRSSGSRPPPSVRAVELTPERAAQVVRQSSNARWVGFLGVVVVILFITIYWFYELAPLGHHRAAARQRGRTPSRSRRRARLQPVRGELRALPRRERRGRHRAGAQSPGQAVRPPVGRLPQQHAGGRRPLRLRQPELADADLVQRGPPARPAELHPDRGPDRVHPRPERPRRTRSATQSCGEPKHRPDHRRGPRRSRAGSTRTTSRHPARRRSRPAGRRVRDRRPGRPPHPVRLRPARRPLRARRPPRDRPRPRCDRSPSRSPPRASRSPRRRTAPADKPFVIEFDNQDAATPHNVEIKDSTGAVKFKGDIFPGVATRQYQVPALAAGTLPVRVHRPPEHDGDPDRSVRSPPTARSAAEDGGRWPSRRSDPAPSYRDGAPCSGCSTPDGWAWASVKAFVWLVIIILMLGYLPDRAYYLTVGRTVDLGVLVWSPINLCPPTERDAAVPGAGRRGRPVGDVTRRAEPARSPGPTARVLQVGTQILYIGGSRRDDRPVDGLRRRDRRDRQLRQVGRGPDASRAARRRERRVRRRQHLRDRWPRRLGRADDDRLRAQPGQPDRRARRVDAPPRTWPCPRRAAETAVGDHARRPAPRRRTRTPTGRSPRP